ncbi:Zinc transporter ZIP1 [Eumeta japonica]|uniref:Zinc transporter ZIP1 n=1 Tax=Eumeta variegata TaxID=151549 RepID=A0A4C1SRP2_EUMVA|nr:Zinc transporter ZIP1 [Eumeta japonica]
MGRLPELPIYLASLIMCSGFFMMYLVEELVHVYINSRENKTANTSFTRVLSIRRSSDDATTSFDKIERPIKETEAQSDGHGHLPTDLKEDAVVVTLRGLLIVLALSIHELFEGLAVGLESSAASVWYMFGAVSAHKYIIAFCIGVELVAARTRSWLSVLYVFTFSFVSALGIGVGILLVGGAGAAEAGLYSVVLQGLACGTLVYVVFFEVWRQDRTGLLQFLCSLLGFIVIVILEALTNVLYYHLCRTKYPSCDRDNNTKQQRRRSARLIMFYKSILCPRGRKPIENSFHPRGNEWIVSFFIRTDHAVDHDHYLSTALNSDFGFAFATFT